MMRGKKKVVLDANGVAVPPVKKDNGMPDKPEGFEAARLALTTELSGAFHVGTGFGTDKVGDRQVPVWRLFVYSNDPEVKVPAEYRGFKVDRRALPTVSTVAWGRK